MPCFGILYNIIMNIKTRLWQNNVKHIWHFFLLLQAFSTSLSECSAKVIKFCNSLCSRCFNAMFWVTRADGWTMGTWTLSSLFFCSSSSSSLETISIRLAFCLSWHSLQNSESAFRWQSWAPSCFMFIKTRYLNTLIWPWNSYKLVLND